MTDYLYIIVLTSLLLLDIMVLLTLFTKKTFWPPMDSKLKLYANWVPTYIFMGGIPLLGILDWHSLGLNNFIITLTGTLFLFVGLYIGIKGLFAFKHLETLGVSQGELKQNGIYALTRNPQYTGDIIWLVGFLLITNSSLLCILIPLAIMWFALAPLAEEPILMSLYKKQYTQYKSNTPRFLNFKNSIDYIKENMR